MTAILVKALADLRRRRVQAAVIFLTVLLAMATGTMALMRPILRRWLRRRRTADTEHLKQLLEADADHKEPDR